ncbi:hypothetical protein [Thiobacillus sp.]|jgi:hypothetical protein|uniref:hypothetical protein n=1 Tax=Thiobacillus sp. TaxID=924 RepID=UPI0025D8D1B1|nr:hypothetical protein [Thiobacillus sp.]
MTRTNPSTCAGILVHAQDEAGLAAARRDFLAHLASLELDLQVETHQEDLALRFQLKPDVAQEWAPDFDTTRLSQRLNLDTGANVADLEREILVAMLVGPVAFEFPSYAEAISAIHIRRNIVQAARRTVLDFHTTEAERPEDHWTYVEGKGFTLLPGRSLIEGLVKATQPEVSGQFYAFSCYRATEYVILLALAQELAARNPALLQRLQHQWENRPIMSGQFHDVFLHEYGAMETPLPPKYYVPGDRLWFRNPDERSADVTGYEGSWVFYLGGGLFSNFWKREQPFSLTTKCLEIFHWRHGAYVDDQGELQMDEKIVEERVRATQNDPTEVARILQRMLRLRDPKGIYQEGGCIDTSREFPRCIHPATADIRLPEQPLEYWEKFLRLLRARTQRLRVAICVSLPLLAPSHHAAAAHSLSEEIREVCHAEQLVRIETGMAAYLGIHSR